MKYNLTTEQINELKKIGIKRYEISHFKVGRIYKISRAVYKKIRKHLRGACNSYIKPIVFKNGFASLRKSKSIIIFNSTGEEMEKLFGKDKSTSADLRNNGSDAEAKRALYQWTFEFALINQSTKKTEAKIVIGVDAETELLAWEKVVDKIEEKKLKENYDNHMISYAGKMTKTLL